MDLSRRMPTAGAGASAEGHAPASGRLDGIELVGLADLPVIAQPAVERVVHLVAVVLGELTIDVVVLEAEDLLRGFHQLRRQFPAELGGAAAADVAHQDGGWAGIVGAVGAAPEASLLQLADRHREPVDVGRHLGRVILAQPLGEAALITSQVPVDRWYEMVGSSTLADAVLDRLTFLY